ncbi:CerR family C-terminal domain-containing protein [Variovorax sp. HJSM1_2]|uniref:CerR family C-terminal domain-containing protein n=1 Tax=Variovorax sp. HJSM1_2 TaxID=3366263 RepID=UPI003BC253A5
MARTSAPISANKPSSRTRAPRSDGVEARTRLLRVALRLFAEHGYAKTSTRQIALEAQVNIAAIRYYFGDKEGLYRAVFTESFGTPREIVEHMAQPGLPLREALTIFFTGYLAPLKQGDMARQALRLHLREMLEPSSVWQEELECDVLKPHAAMVALLGQHLGICRADDELHRLVLTVTGLAMLLFVQLEAIEIIRPSLIKKGAAIDRWVSRLVEDALALIEVERTRRATPSEK